MKVLGLTGGIGMGKSTVGQMLVERGIQVVDTDVLARKIVEPGQPALGEIQEVFGNAVIGDNGQLRRDELARLAFANAAARQKLESITHPRIRELWKGQVEVWRQDGVSLAFVVIPLLFETGAEKDLDSVLCVGCSHATHWRRLTERGWTGAQIKQRLAAQLPAEKKMAKANYVLWTEGDLSILRRQLDRVLARMPAS